jgi:hypothetical protein
VTSTEEMRFDLAAWPRPAERDVQSRDAFVEALRAAVPLWMAHWWGSPPAVREARGRYCGQVVELGVQVRGPFNRLAEAVAIAAYEPGGVRVFGQRWEVRDR